MSKIDFRCEKCDKQLTPEERLLIAIFGGDKVCGDCIRPGACMHHPEEVAYCSTCKNV